LPEPAKAAASRLSSGNDDLRKLASILFTSPRWEEANLWRFVARGVPGYALRYFALIRP